MSALKIVRAMLDQVLQIDSGASQAVEEVWLIALKCDAGGESRRIYRLETSRDIIYRCNYALKDAHLKFGVDDLLDSVKTYIANYYTYKII